MASDSFLQKIRMANMFSIPKEYEEERPRSRQGITFDRNPMSLQQQMPVQQPGLRRAEQSMDVVFQQPLSEQIRSINQAERLSPTPLTELQKRELALKEKAIESTSGIKERQLDINQQKADIQAFKAQNPNVKIIAPRGGNIQAINPQTGEVIAEFGPTGTMSEESRIALEQAGRMEVVGEQGRQARETEGVRQEGRESLQELRARHEREQAELEGTLPPRTAGLPTQEKTAIQVRYNQLINQRPELRDFIELIDGMPVVKTPREGISIPGMDRRVGARGPTPEQAEEINQLLYGKTTPQTEVVNTTVEPPVSRPEGGMKDPQQRAIEELKKIGFDNPTQDMIAEAIKDLGLK